MASQLETIEIPTRDRWRKWLQKNHRSSPGVWLVFYKGERAATWLGREDSVREALCFGWIDSLIKRLDDERYAVKHTPRTAGSRWSAVNRKRWGELKAAGRLQEAGLAAAPTGRGYAARPSIPELPGYIGAAIRANPKAWSFFQTLAPTYRRHFVVWVHIAKRAGTRERRLREAVALLAAGKKLGLK